MSPPQAPTSKRERVRKPRKSVEPSGDALAALEVDAEAEYLEKQFTDEGDPIRKIPYGNV